MTRQTLWDWLDVSGECWLWTGYIDENGYGRFGLGAQRVHVLVYETLIGPVPEGMELDHTCRVRHCANPKHLEVVTHVENSRRGLNGVLKTHCPHGHEYTPENTYLWQGFRRSCRQCYRNRATYDGRKEFPV